MRTSEKYCRLYPTIGYWSGLGGFEIHGIEHEVSDDFVYAVSNAWGNPKRYGYHKLRVNQKTERPYIRCYGYRIYLDDCCRMDGGF